VTSSTTGTKETLVHLPTLGGGAVPLLVYLFLKINVLVIGLMIVAFLVLRFGM